MNIIISGAGKVGFNLAKKLSIGHNITIIDKNIEALYRIQDDLDVMVLHGDVEESKTFEKVIDKNINLFIAVTNIDNTNLISCLIADTILTIDKKFIRLKKETFNNPELKSRLNIDKFIFPIELASNIIASLLSYPKANNVKFFKYTKNKLISIIVSKDFQPSIINQSYFRIVGIKRDKEFFIPNSSDIKIMANDLIYLFGDEEKIKVICKETALESSSNIDKCVVFGAGDLGIAISKRLVKEGCVVKLLDKDLNLCNRANDKLGGMVSVINLKYSSHEVFETEGLDSADIFIASTDNDEFNIIKSLEAKERGIKKVISINNDLEYYSLMYSLGITVVRGPKISAYNTIMEEINSTKIILEKNFCGIKGILFMRKIFSNSKLINKTIQAPNSFDGLIFYIRNDDIFNLNSSLLLEKDDLIVIFVKSKIGSDIKKWLYEL